MQKLSNREIAVLHYLSEGNNYAETREHFGMSPQNLSSHCQNIRRKTGIQETRDAAECRRFIRKLPPRIVEDAINPPTTGSARPPTRQQMEVFRRIARGQTYHQIAAELRLHPQTVQNTLTAGAKRVGMAHLGWERTRAIRDYVKRNDREDGVSPSMMDDPAFR